VSLIAATEEWQAVFDQIDAVRATEKGKANTPGASHAGYIISVLVIPIVGIVQR
jgi:hypothetical protein